MSTTKVEQTLHGSARGAQSVPGPMKKGRSLRFLSGLQFELIIPYLILTLILAAISIFIITVLVVDSDQERFNNSLLDASRSANDGIVQQERNQLDRLRFLIFADGMAQAMYDKNSDQIFNLMRPILENAQIDLMTAVDTSGKEIVTFGRSASDNSYHLQNGVDFSGVNSVTKTLAGLVDNQGDKFTELIKLQQGAVLFTSAPVRDANQQLAGVMMVGSYLDNVLGDLKKSTFSDVIIVDGGGNLIATTLTGKEDGFENLPQLALSLQSDVLTQFHDVSLNNRVYRVAYSPLVIRGEQKGWIGVVKNADYQVSPAVQSRGLFILVFALGTFGVTLVGYFQARSIARPILRLRTASQAVAAGNLKINTGLRRADEIGDLAEAFDTMTLHLRDRTEEAEHLYAESLQRNKELAEINARLEAAQLQLIQSEKLAAIGQLTAGIVHDVKNPFAVIMGMAEVLSEGEQLDGSTQHGLRVIRESAVKGNNIVSDLLKFARQSDSEMRLTDLRETIQTAIRLTAYLTRRFQTNFVLPETPVYLTFDGQQIEQVLINLIHNAVQSMPNGGELQIGLAQKNETVRITVQDSGCGIPAEHLKRIFDPFFTTKPEGEGTGLGLSVSYGIIANHHGRIEVESEVDKGSTFTIVLPVNQPAIPSGETNR